MHECTHALGCFSCLGGLIFFFSQCHPPTTGDAAQRPPRASARRVQAPVAHHAQQDPVGGACRRRLRNKTKKHTNRPTMRADGRAGAPSLCHSFFFRFLALHGAFLFSELLVVVCFVWYLFIVAAAGLCGFSTAEASRARERSVFSAATPRAATNNRPLVFLFSLVPCILRGHFSVGDIHM